MGKPKDPEVFEQWKKKISDSLKGRVSPRKGKPCSEEQKRKQSETLKRKYASGEMVSFFKGKSSWSKGLTKDIDERLKKMGENLSDKYKTGEIVSPQKGKTIDNCDIIKRRINKYSERIKNGEIDTTEKSRKISQKLKGIKRTKEHYQKAVNTRRKNGSYDKAWNSGLTKETDERIERVAKSIRRGYIDGTHKLPIPKFKGFKSGFQEDLGHHIRSGWEYKICKYLIELGIRYKYEKFRYKLKLDDKEITYTPDLYLDDYKLFIEIKGGWGGEDNNLYKYELFVEQYPENKVLLIESNLYQKVEKSKEFLLELINNV